MMENGFIISLIGLIPLLILWDVIWRGLALWKSARNGQIYWFIALLLVNSLGIVPILYIKFFQKITKVKANRK